MYPITAAMHEDEYEGDEDQELLRMQRRAEAAEARVGILERDLEARVGIFERDLADTRFDLGMTHGMLYADAGDRPRPMRDRDMQAAVYVAALLGVLWGLWRYRGYLAFWRPPLWVFRKLWTRLCGMAYACGYYVDHRFLPL